MNKKIMVSLFLLLFLLPTVFGFMDTVKRYYITTNNNWEKLKNFPAACGSSQYVTAVGNTLTCSDFNMVSDVNNANFLDGLDSSEFARLNIDNVFANVDLSGIKDLSATNATITGIAGIGIAPNSLYTLNISAGDGVNGIRISATNRRGIQVQNTGGYTTMDVSQYGNNNGVVGSMFKVMPVATNAVVHDAWQVGKSISDGLGADGMGVGFKYSLENDNTQNVTSGRHYIKYTDASDDTEDSFFAIETIVNGILVEAGRFENGDFNSGDVNGKIGHFGDDSNYTIIEADGTVEFKGNATVFEDLRVSVNMVRVPTSKAPTWTAYRGGQLLSFADEAVEGNENEVYFAAQIPHSYKEGSNIMPHVHWIPDSNGTGETIQWKLSYTWTDLNQSPILNETSMTVMSETIGTTEADKHIVTSFPEIDGTGKTITSMLILKLSRNSSHANDDYAGTPLLMEFDFHFEIDTIGSKEEFIK